MFGRRGPAQAKFTPLELRELDHSPTIEVIVDPEDIDYDEGSEAARRHSKQVDMVANTLQDWAIRDVGDRPHKLFLHFFESPTEIARRGRQSRRPADRAHRARRHRQRQAAPASSTTGTCRPSTARSGYLSQNIANLPFDEQAGTVPNEAGRVVADESADGTAPVPARHLRHRLDQARPGRPDRPHQGRRQRDRRLPARGPRRLRRRRRPGRGRRHRLPRGQGRPVHHLGGLVPPRRPRALPRRARGPRARQGRRARGHAPRQRAPQGVTGAHPTQKVWRASHTRAGSAQTPPGGACCKACSTPTSTSSIRGSR